jgi:zinc protease
MALATIFTIGACAGPQKEQAAGDRSAASDKAPAKSSDPATKAVAEFATTPDAEFRAQKPPPLPTTPHFSAPVPVQRKLKNGIPVLIVENHQLPIVAVDLVVKTGRDGDPIARAGLSDLVAAMLTEGTRDRSAAEFAEAVDSLAAQLTAQAVQSGTRVHLNCLSDTLPQAIDLLADAVQHPAFRPPDFERVRGIHVAKLMQKKGMPAAIAEDEMNRALYGAKHPWGQPTGGTLTTAKSIARADLVKFYNAWYHPNNVFISVSGDTSPDEMIKLLEAPFAGWKPKPLPKMKLPPMPDLKTRTITLVDKPGASQSQVWVGGRLFGANHPDATPMRVANYILGGLFSSRLNLNLREDKAYSYGVRSRVALAKTTGTIIASGGIIAKNTPEALVEYEKELVRFAKGDITDDELAKAKTGDVVRLPSVLETNDAVAIAISSLVLDGLPLDYYKTLPEEVGKVTKSDLSRVVSKYLKPTQWPVIVVGPRVGNEDKIRDLNLGPVEVRSVDGKPGASKPAQASLGG